MTGHPRILTIVGYCMEMHVKSLSQGLNVNLALPGLESGTFWSQSEVFTTRPQRRQCWVETRKGRRGRISRAKYMYALWEKWPLYLTRNCFWIALNLFPSLWQTHLLSYSLSSWKAMKIIVKNVVKSREVKRVTGVTRKRERMSKYL